MVDEASGVIPIRGVWESPTEAWLKGPSIVFEDRLITTHLRWVVRINIVGSMGLELLA